MRISDWSSDVCSSDLEDEQSESDDVRPQEGKDAGKYHASRHFPQYAFEHEDIHADRRRDEADLGDNDDENSEPDQDLSGSKVAEIEPGNHRIEDRHGQ